MLFFLLETQEGTWRLMTRIIKGDGPLTARYTQHLLDNVHNLSYVRFMQARPPFHFISDLPSR